MRDFFKEYKWNGKNFLILGKGTSLDQIGSHNISDYLTLGLNHVVRNHKVHIAHVIDLDVVDRVGEVILENCDILVMPYHPHVRWCPNPNFTLDDISAKHPIISKFREQGRLYGYNLSTCQKWNDSPVVKARYYSAEAAVDLLGNLGVKTIRTLGVDGGHEQSAKFEDIGNMNKERGYDLQWGNIRRSISRWGLDYAPLGIDSPIRIFVGAGEAQLVPALVLKHSILKHATMSVDVTPMIDWVHPMPKDPRNRPRTPFSFQRFMIPEKCDYKGSAIYLDSDMLVFSNIKEFWHKIPAFHEVVTARNGDIDKHKAQFSVIGINCDQARWNIKEIVEDLDYGRLTYEDLVFKFAHSGTVMEGIDPDWNSLEEYTPGKTKLLHYTEMYNQPWLANPNHPLGHLWFNELKEAVADGSITRTLVETHVARGWLLPKCLEVIK